MDGNNINGIYTTDGPGLELATPVLKSDYKAAALSTALPDPANSK